MRNTQKYTCAFRITETSLWRARERVYVYACVCCVSIYILAGALCLSDLQATPPCREHRYSDMTFATRGRGNSQPTGS